MKTKYVGKPYKCRRCNHSAAERWWWVRSPIPPCTLRVAYFCDSGCAERYAGYDMQASKESLKASILANVILGE